MGADAYWLVDSGEAYRMLEEEHRKEKGKALEKLKDRGVKDLDYCIYEFHTENLREWVEYLWMKTDQEEFKYELNASENGNLESAPEPGHVLKTDEDYEDLVEQGIIPPFKPEEERDVLLEIADMFSRPRIWIKTF